MEILYIITLILLGISFMMFKKSEEKINFIKWLIIYIVSLFGYNVFIGMLLGLLNITSHLWLLSIINMAFTILLEFKTIENKGFQKYYVRKLDIISIIFVLMIFAVMFVKDLYIYNGDISHMAMDSAIHYRAAKHYADNLKIFINVEDKTFFNFNVMQTGAYINDGIFMNVIHGITGIGHEYLFQAFETMVLFLSGLSFYAFFGEKIKTKRGLVASLVLFALYIYGYPYNSWFYGFSYLSVGIMMVAILLPITECLYSEEKITKKLTIPLIVLAGTGLIFSYCLFVPAVFSAICIYCFLKDITSKEGKKYLKFFKKTTLIVTGLLLIITAVGIGYIVVPTFFIEGQTKLTEAIKLEGAIYSGTYENLIPYTPFLVLFLVQLVKRIKEKSLRFLDVFSVFIMGYLALLMLGVQYNLASKYYMYKVYFIMWLVTFSITIDYINENVDKKIFRIDAIIIFMIYVFFTTKTVAVITNINISNPGKYSMNDLYNMFIENLFTIHDLLMFLLLAFFTVLPQLIDKINLSKITEKLSSKFKSEKIKNLLNKISVIEIKRICISGYIYVILWGVFVCGWVWLKAGLIISEDTKHNLPNLVGIYYEENCNNRKLVDLTQNLNSNQIKLIKYARENFKDMTVENTELMTKGYYARIWSTAMLEFSSEKVEYGKVVQDTNIYTLKNALEDNEKKYIVKLVSRDANDLKEYQEELENVKQTENVEILLENENGYVAKINR